LFVNDFIFFALVFLTAQLIRVGAGSSGLEIRKWLNCMTSNLSAGNRIPFNIYNG